MLASPAASGRPGTTGMRGPETRPRKKRRSNRTGTSGRRTIRQTRHQRDARTGPRAEPVVARESARSLLLGNSLEGRIPAEAEVSRRTTSDGGGRRPGRNSSCSGNDDQDREAGFTTQYTLALCATDPPLALSQVPLRQMPPGATQSARTPPRGHGADRPPHQLDARAAWLQPGRADLGAGRSAAAGVACGAGPAGAPFELVRPRGGDGRPQSIFAATEGIESPTNAEQVKWRGATSLGVIRFRVSTPASALGRTSPDKRTRRTGFSYIPTIEPPSLKPTASMSRLPSQQSTPPRRMS